MARMMVMERSNASDGGDQEKMKNKITFRL